MYNARWFLFLSCIVYLINRVVHQRGKVESTDFHGEILLVIEPNS